MKIAVVALGKIGLPLALQFASRGHDVVGVDIAQKVVDDVNRGAAPFPGEAGLQDLLTVARESGRLRATISYEEAIPTAEVVVVVVPLFVDPKTAEPAFESMDSATRSIGAHLRRGTLVSYETTLPVGTTRHRWKPRLEQSSGLAEGSGFHLVFSPERVYSGRIFEDLRKYPKLIGGLSVEGAALATHFYESVLDFDLRPDLDRPNGVWDLGSPEAAELAKLAETTYRDVNIALANQFARFSISLGIDVGQVIRACNSQPFSHIHQPGIAVGGHCIPVYPRLYLWSDPAASVVRAAREANETMPGYAVGLLEAAAGSLEGTIVAILGAAYRGGVKETAFSGVFPIRDALLELGAHVVVHDPLYTADELRALGLSPYQLGNEVGAAILHTDHKQYRKLRPHDLPGIRALVDGRRMTAASDWPGVEHRAI
jgi:nucleotide sugar dehydrogenase